jgi:extradiol dioxygenase family protein
MPPLGVLLTERRKNMTDPLLPRIAQIELHCTDQEEARRFYCEVLGLEKVGEFAHNLFVKCGDSNLLIQKVDNPRKGSVVYFSADNRIHEVANSLKKRGVEFTEEPSCIARGFEGKDIWLGFFDDPWGNPLALLAEMPMEDKE